MNSRSGWYLILRKTNTVLLVQQNSAKGRLLFFDTYLQRLFNFTKQDRRGKRNPSATAEVFDNIPIFQLSHSRQQGLFSSVRKRSSTDSCSKTAMPFFCTYKMTFPGTRFTSEHKRAFASTDCRRRRSKWLESLPRQEHAKPAVPIAACSHRILHSILHCTH